MTFIMSCGMGFLATKCAQACCETGTSGSVLRMLPPARCCAGVMPCTKRSINSLADMAAAPAPHRPWPSSAASQPRVTA